MIIRNTHDIREAVMAKRKIVLISDLHIDRWDWERRKIFHEFLKYVEGNAAELYILGDLLDFPSLRGENIWPRHEELINKIRSLAKKGVAVTYVIGNHDISLRGVEIEQKNLTITYRDRKRPLVKTFFGQEIYMEHGHVYDPLFQEHIYDLMDFVRTVSGKAIDTSATQLLKDLARVFQIKSLKRDSGLPLKPYSDEIGVPDRFLKIWEIAAEQILKRMRYNIVFFGHTHSPMVVPMATKGQYYVNTGDWVTHSTFVEMTPKSLWLKDWMSGVTLSKIKL